MQWLNFSGIIFMILIMIPNIIYASYVAKHNGGFENTWQGKGSKLTHCFEQIGRYGCFAFMIFNIPGTCFGWLFSNAFTIYLIGNISLILIYCLIWIFCFKSNSLFKAWSLSVIPSVIFLSSGIMSQSVLLFGAALIFAPCHIVISVKNIVIQKNKETNY